MEDIILDSYDVVIGLEVHVQLKTKSKIFSSDAVTFGSPANTHVSTITLGHPGTLPKLNREVVAMGIKMALACRGAVAPVQIFDRKNYFYPDLPKGYQITQDKTPLCRGGYLAVPTRSGLMKVALEKIHMEEDAGKSIHQEGEEETLLDFNRAGTPLLEVVTKPVIGSATDAAAVVSEVRKLVRYLDISDGNMEEGSLRCDANVSVKPKGSAILGKKVEIKNLNSIRNLSHAITYDVERQIGLTEAGHPVHSETRAFDVTSGKTFPMRTKEELNDYRYFPDPDLSPLEISEAWLEEIRRDMPALPDVLFEKFIETYQWSPTDALTLTETRAISTYVEELCRHTTRYKAAANWMMGPVRSVLNSRGIGMESFPLIPEKLAALIVLVEDGKVSFSSAAQKLLPAWMEHPEKEPLELARALDLVQDEDEGALENIVNEVIKEFPLKVEAYQQGKTGIVTMFMGEVMKRTRGKIDPKKANALIVKKLSEK